MVPTLTSGQRSTDKELRVNDYYKITVLLTSVMARGIQIVTHMRSRSNDKELTSSLRCD